MPKFLFSKTSNYKPHRIDTWRPVISSGNSHSGASRHTDMKRYFVGGTPELEDLGYCGGGGGGVTSSGGGGILNRYGFRTATSGWVKLKLDIVHQSRAFMPSRCGL